MSRVHLSIQGGVAELRLDNPAKLNAFTVDMLGQLAGHLDTIERSIAHIKCPVLLLHGERDKTVPPSTSHIVAQRLAHHGTSAEHHGLPGLGHLAHEEAPERHAQMVADFARKLGMLA